MTQGGGGGYGDPLQRDPDMVSRDVKDGYVSADRVAAAYGVVLGAGDGRADQPATTQLRMQQRKAVQP